MSKRIVFLHPDLGIGGAERLVVDAALALKEKGHFVHIITSHHDKSHCFIETKNGELPITVVGDWLPRNIFNRFYALCAYIKMIYAAIYLIFFSDLSPDLVFCDIVSACIPILKLKVQFVIFYCHFPDQLLSKPGNIFKTIYRLILNWLEEKSTGCADKILVNSKFTRNVFKNTFNSINEIPEVLYPSINTDFFDSSKPKNVDFISSIKPENFMFLSINRYERKKNISLAIKAFCELKNLLTVEEWNNVKLVVAGGYDTRVLENVEYYIELKNIAEQLKISNNIYFLKSPTDDEKLALLQKCDCLIYTPSNEHFGIVPLEAMYSEKPVIAVNSGGPTETIANEASGFLCEPNNVAFSEAMSRLIKNTTLKMNMGKEGKERFKANFSYIAFSNQLNSIVNNLCDNEKND
uniref:Alpha-1,3/1,6-mannosyltransferase ALG2 n=1 Tax=Clastoptera arizonana TaxID=38151 RepID=A0A1B6BYD9_9HEMI